MADGEYLTEAIAQAIELIMGPEQPPTFCFHAVPGGMFCPFCGDHVPRVRVAGIYAEAAVRVVRGRLDL